MKKPRREARYLVDIPVAVRAERGLLQGSVRDLSVYGARLRVQGMVRVGVGERVGVTLAVPGFAPMDFSGEVRWICRPQWGEGCDCGVELFHGAAALKTMQLLVWELQSGTLGDVERRSRTRVRMRQA